jgi:acetyl esterase/lipase
MASENVIQVPAFELPESALLDDASQTALQKYRDYLSDFMQEAMASSTPPANTGIDELRELERTRFHRGQPYKSLRSIYDVEISTGLMGGVFTETFTPTAGVSSKNKDRILINLHGGSFESGSRTNSQLESLPVAELGKIKVISVDYRMAPEHRFPAATDDVFAVYQALLEKYKPENIGLYGASAGAVLTAQTIVRLQQKSLPLPGAVGMIAGGATMIDVGDSVAVVGAIQKSSSGLDLAEALKFRYYEGVDCNNPEVAPSLSDEFISKFPSSLLASSTRDFLLSSVVATHSQLTRLGVAAELHVWEGLDHVFHYNPDLPETTELHQVTVRFFDKHLGGGSGK